MNSYRNLGAKVLEFQSILNPKNTDYLKCFQVRVPNNSFFSLSEVVFARFFFLQSEIAIGSLLYKYLDEGGV